MNTVEKIRKSFRLRLRSMVRQQRDRAYSVLDNYKLKHEFGYEMAEWKQALKIYLEKRNLLKKEKGSFNE